MNDYLTGGFPAILLAFWAKAHCDQQSVRFQVMHAQGLRSPKFQFLATVERHDTMGKTGATGDKVIITEKVEQILDADNCCSRIWGGVDTR